MQIKKTEFLSNPLLDKEDRARAVQFDEKGHHHKERGKKDKPDGGEENIKKSFCTHFFHPLHRSLTCSMT